VLVNIVNLIDHRNSNGRIKVIRFKTQAEFSEYTLNGRTYSRKEAKAKGFIKALLREL
jgi:hypothetical protein